MDLYILRHGEAEPQEAGIPDAGRKLTPAGKRALRNVLELARRAKVAPQAILTSPLTRATSTADIASAVLKCERIIQTRNLLPSAAPTLVWKEIAALHATDVLVAGHEPQLGHLITFLLEAAVVVDLKKGALVRISTKATHGPPRGVLKWMITPKLADATR
jgi:phosphohistidine phosphatase